MPSTPPRIVASRKSPAASSAASNDRTSARSARSPLQATSSQAARDAAGRARAPWNRASTRCQGPAPAGSALTAPPRADGGRARHGEPGLQDYRGGRDAEHLGGLGEG